MADDPNALWRPQSSAIVPKTAGTASEIAQYAKQLNKRDVTQIVQAFNAGSYEMVTSFVWMRAMSALKVQLATLGPEFIGEMLGRAESVRPGTLDENVTDLEAIGLAEDLGMITSTDAMRLRHAFEVLTHFGSRPPGPPDDGDDDGESLAPEEALGALRACIQSILGHPRIEVTTQFVRFRRDLESRSFSPEDQEVTHVAGSSYFVQRTTLSILLALIKKAEGAQLEHALANVNVLLPVLWPVLHKADRWQTGQTYAEIHSAGRAAATAGLRKALLRVKGFDYVPENLRSNSFIQAAAEVIRAHEGWNNFYNEPGPMRVLSELGTAIPVPAFATCMSATLSVRLGNTYGISYDAQEYAETVLRGVSKDRWEYYLTGCLPGDRRILYKLLNDSGPRLRWMELVRQFAVPAPPAAKLTAITRLVEASHANKVDAVQAAVTMLLRALGYEVGDK